MTDKKPSPKDEKQIAAQNSEKITEEEIGGFGKKGNGLPEPTRHNDWEVKGRCSDF